jgi:hypothetical protein
MAAAGRNPAITAGVVGAPSNGIELVWSKNSLPVAQIRVICKNVPQISMTNKITFCQGKIEILTSAYLHATTLDANWVYCLEAQTWARPRGGDYHKQLMFLTWMGSYTCSCKDTKYKEPRFTVPFDGHNEPWMISLKWPGTSRLIGGGGNH